MNIPLSLRYQDCVSCGHRTEFTCIKCGYCYSCHWKREQPEKIELRDNLKDFYVSLSKPSDDEDKQKQKLEQYEAKDNELERWETLNVLGQPAEPICTYIDAITSFQFMVQDVAGVNIQ